MIIEKKYVEVFKKNEINGEELQSLLKKRKKNRVFISRR